MLEKDYYDAQIHDDELGGVCNKRGKDGKAHNLIQETVLKI
jgi:hypothetical protein